MTFARSLLALALLGGIAHAQPGARKEAGEHFKAGEKAQAEGRFRDAIAEYERAYGLVPHANALFNIGVCYEKLGEWSQAADYYERYLDDQENAPDAATVAQKVRDLRAKSQPAPVPAPQPPPESGPTPQPGPIDGGTPPIGTVAGTTRTVGRPELHVGVSYGLGFGDAPVERYLGHGGLRLGNRLDVDAIIGQFGKNDVAIGGMLRVLLPGSRYAIPFVRATATIGYAKQDSSSIAETRFPLGVEAGGGVQLGTRGRFEVDAVLRWTRGGFDMASTTADSYINDSLAVAFDVGVAFDLGFTSTTR